MTNIKTRLIVMNFLEFAVWGAYLTSLGSFLDRNGLSEDIAFFYAVQGFVSIFMPAVIGIVADRWVQAQKVLSWCQLIAGLFMMGAGTYAMTTPQIQFWPLFLLYSVSVAFYMPTIGLANSVAYNALNRAGLDTIKSFPPIRVFGTVGFICSMLLVNFTGWQNTYTQLYVSGLLSIVLAAYAITMPACPTSKGESKSLAQAFGLDAFKLFKNPQMAMFFCFSMLLGVDLQITNSYANPFIQSFGEIAGFADNWGVKNANALISLSQISETLCILLIPFFLKRFGIKVVMLTSMFAWVLRFGFFGLGNPGGGVWLFILSMIVYGVAFDFFNVSGSLYVDQQTKPELRSSAQGLFMLMTNGIGATIGTLIARLIINHNVYSQDPGMAQVAGWKASWLIFAAYALVVGLLFMVLFRYKHKPVPEAEQTIASPADGFVEL